MAVDSDRATLDTTKLQWFCGIWGHTLSTSVPHDDFTQEGDSIDLFPDDPEAV